MKIGDKVTVKAKGPYFAGDDRWGSAAVAGETGIVTRVSLTHVFAQFPSKKFNWAVPLVDLESQPPVAGTVTQERKSLLPSVAGERKNIPLASGVLDYFPAALMEVAKVSYEGNLQHNPGQELHWARGKSTDQSDTIIRHFLERGTMDTDGMRHSAKLAWRALALLQIELEAEGAPLARGARLPEEKK